VTRRWPNPEDTQSDRDRTIAHSYRALAYEHATACTCGGAPAAAVEALDRGARELGQHWIAPLPDTTNPGELVSTERAAELMGLDESTIRSWHSRAWVPVTHYKGGWDMRELRAYKASQGRRRGHR
jgi:hypothetical protein